MSRPVQSLVNLNDDFVEVGDAVGTGGDAVGTGGDAVGTGGDAVGTGRHPHQAGLFNLPTFPHANHAIPTPRAAIIPNIKIITITKTHVIPDIIPI